MLRQRPQGGAVYAPMRSGKCKIAIDFACVLEIKGLIDAVLVVCPLSVKSVWRKQVKLHSQEDSSLEWKIVNYEALYERQRVHGTREWYPVQSQALREYCRGKKVLIVVDECHKIGNAQSRQSRELYNLAKEMGVEHRVIMTGTPFHRKKKLLVFGQYKFLDQSIFGTSYAEFKKTYSRHGGQGNHILLGYRKQRKFRKKVARKAFVMARIPKVPTQHTIWSYPLEEGEEAYSEMASEGLWRDIEAPNPLAKATRLSQIASGVIRHPSSGRLIRVGKEKQRAFTGLLESLRDNDHEKVVVFSRWLPPMRDIGEVGRGLGYDLLPFHGGVPPDLRERRIDHFHESKDPALFISQTATGSMGIDLSAASVAIFYTMPGGLVDFDQDLARIQKFSDNRTLSYYYMCADGTIEEAQVASFRAGLEFVDTLTRHPDLLNYLAHG